MSWIRKYPTAPRTKESAPAPAPAPAPPVVQKPSLTILNDYLVLSKTPVQPEVPKTSTPPPSVQSRVQTAPPSSIRDENGNFLLFDIFIRRNVLYFVSTFYGTGLPKLQIVVDGIVPTEVAYDQGEPIRYFWLPVGERKEFSCRINGRQMILRPDVVDGRNRIYPLAIATLFKYETPKDIERFLTYYRAQGVAKFYLYYNGSTLPANLPTGNDILYKTWDFPYWNEKAQYKHNAQMTFLTSFRLRYSEANEWSAIIDLDEYILVNRANETILSFLNKSGWHLYQLKSYWARISDDERTVLVNSAPNPSQTKYIYKHFFKGMIGIHKPKPYREQDFLEGGHDSALQIAHIVNPEGKYQTAFSSNQNRESLIVEPGIVRSFLISLSPEPLLQPSQTQVQMQETQSTSTNI